MTEEKKEQAWKYLSCHRDRNINMLGALRAGLSEIRAVSDRGCLLRTGGMIWQLSAEDGKTALELYDSVPEDAKMLVVQKEEQISLIAERFRPVCMERYHNAWYAGSAIELPPVSASVRKLGEEDLETVLRYYCLPSGTSEASEDTRTYLAGRIPEGNLLGVFVGETLAGFVGTHDEGAIGMLTVVPEFRRRGFASYLETAAIRAALERGHIPFGQINGENEASLALQRSLGMTVSAEKVCWMNR